MGSKFLIFSEKKSQEEIQRSTRKREEKKAIQERTYKEKLDQQIRNRDKATKARNDKAYEQSILKARWEEKKARK